MATAARAIILLTAVVTLLEAAVSINFTVPESVPIGHIIGYVNGTPAIGLQPNFFVVFPQPDTEKVLSVDERTGEVTAIGELDFETNRSYEFLAVRVDGGGEFAIRVDVLDENDHAPAFPNSSVKLEISEFARLNSEFPLPLAEDADGAPYDVQKYRIAEGNVNNVFRLITRSVNNRLYADLVVNGALDREYREKYDLLVEALDGGEPPRTAKLRTEITILDANDNAPAFSAPRYSANVPANATLLFPVLTVEARDADLGDNARITYRLAPSRIDVATPFSLDSVTGLLRVSGPLTAGSNYELVAVAADGGTPSLESTVFLSIHVMENSLSTPHIDVLWLTDSSQAVLPENTTLGSVVARISLSNLDAKSVFTMSGCDQLCMQQSQDSHVYLLLICGPFDREITPWYQLQFVLKMGDDIVLDHPLHLIISDVNDNPPRWVSSALRITLNGSSTDGGQEWNLAAEDPDEGDNGRLRYTVLDSTAVTIDPDTGMLQLNDEVDCATGSELSFRIRAEDHGRPSLYAELAVTADLISSSHRPPLFERPLYEVDVNEDADVGSCILKVKASKSECGSSTGVRYSFKKQQTVFNIDDTSGTICIGEPLDFETAARYQLTVIATDSAGNLASCIVNIMVKDVNDNSPIFSPTLYNATIREGTLSSSPILRVLARDADRGVFGQIRYRIEDDKEGIFRVEPQSGLIFVEKALRPGTYFARIIARDGSGLTSDRPGIMALTVLPANAVAPQFLRDSFNLSTSEEILPGISIGEVQAVGADSIRYSIYDGDPEHLFLLNPESGRITVARYLDAEKYDVILLNVKAEMAGGHRNDTQVVVQIRDENDNAPKFEVEEMEVHVREDHTLHEPITSMQALDADKGENGAVSYSLESNEKRCPVLIQPVTGLVVLVSELDYETLHECTVKIRARDAGIPPRTATATLHIKIIDVNDNPPFFDLQRYEIEISEDAPRMTELLQFAASDADSGLNSKIVYRLEEGIEDFGVNAKSGQLFVKKTLDRERKEEYEFLLFATDKGKPTLSSNVSVHIRVRDVNDNAPNCSTLLSPITVSADEEIRRPFTTLVVSDPDKDENGIVTYRLQHEHPIFEVKKTGEILLKKALKLTDTKQDYRLSVIASDSAVDKKSTVCQITVRVVGGGSKIKLETGSVETIRLPEECIKERRKGCEVARVKAHGVDKWSLQPSETATHFEVERGIVKTSELFNADFFRSPRHFIVHLQDVDDRQKSVAFKVHALYSSHNHSNATILRIFSNSPVGTKIISLGSEEKSSKNIFFSLSQPSDFFELDESSGDLYLSSRLSPIEMFHNLSISKFSTASDFDPQILSIFVEIEPKTTPKPRFEFDILRLSVQEDTSIGTTLGRLNATVESEEAEISYRLVGATESFAVDATSGELSLIRELHCEENTKHIFVVEARCGDQKASATVFVDITDINDHAPQIISAPEAWLFDSSSPSSFHYVVAVDEDFGENSRLSFSLIDDRNGSFAINSTSGALSLLRRIEREVKITVSVSDHGHPPRSTEQEIVVRTKEEKQNWSFFKKTIHKYSLWHGSQQNGSKVADFGRRDGVTFRILPAKAVPFTVDETLGILETTRAPPPDVYKFLVLATDRSGSFDWTSVVVDVKSRLEASPRIMTESCSNVTLKENRRFSGLKRIFVRNSAASDLQFFIQSGNDRDVFKIDSKTGVISCSELDREMKTEYLLVIGVEDKINEKKDSCTVRITVADENDNQPVFGSDIPQVIEITDATTVGSILHRFSAHDEDEAWNGAVFFTLADDPSHTMDMDTKSGMLVFARDVPTVEKEWMIRVLVEDQGLERRLNAEKFIRVRDARTKTEWTDIQPEFLRMNYMGVVEEGRSRGVRVAQVSLSEKSSRDAPTTFSIVGGNQDGAFEIDQEGVVSTAQELDREIRGEYTLTIIATGPTSLGNAFQPTTHLHVKVLDMNDNPPAFPPLRSKKLSESLPVNSYVTSISASDVDVSSQLEFSLSPASEHFYIEKFTGAIYLASALDFEMNERHELGIQVTDGVHISKTVLNIEVADENDNAPEFSKPLFETELAAEAEEGRIVARLRATDDDKGENGRVSYQLLTPSPYFNIDPLTGILTIGASRLTKGAVHYLSVKAIDGGDIPKSSTAAVRIRVVEDALTAQPKFDHTFYRFLVPEELPVQSVIGSVAPENFTLTPLEYRILDDAASKFFAVDSLGRIFLTRPLDRERNESFQFHMDVSAEMSGSSSSSTNSTATVSVRVEDVNDNSPVFIHAPSSILIHENLKHGETLARLTASDADSDDAGRVSYRIFSGNDFDVFDLNPETGVMTYNEWSDEQILRNPGGSWILRIIALDHGKPSRFSDLEVRVRVDVGAWSGSAPFFVLPSYSLHLSETTSIGSTVFRAKATNRVGIQLTPLQYSLKDNDELFWINSTSGEVVLKSVLDFELRTSYEMSVRVRDNKGRAALVPLLVQVLPVDEHPPVFSKPSYTFQVPLNTEVGAHIGTVVATDSDAGEDGRVVFAVEGARLVGVDPSTGRVVLRQPVSRDRNLTIEQFTVIASSGPNQLSRVTVYLEFGDFPSARSASRFGLSLNLLTLAVGAAVLLFVLLLLSLLFLILHLRKKQKDATKPKKQIYSVSKGHIAVMADFDRLSPELPLPAIRMPDHLPNVNQTHSLASSNSMESSVFVKTRPTNLSNSRSAPDSGIDPDTLSMSSSITEYLTSLGANPHPLPPPRPRPRRLPGRDGVLEDLLYARVDEILSPGRMNLSMNERFYDADHLIMPTSQLRVSPPTFQPLSEIFEEISRLQREQRGEAATSTSTASSSQSGHKVKKKQMKTEFVQIEI